MNFEEIISKLRDGKSVRRKVWKDDDRISIHIKEKVWRYDSVSQINSIYNFCLEDLNADDWEVVK